MDLHAPPTPDDSLDAAKAEPQTTSFQLEAVSNGDSASPDAGELAVESRNNNNGGLAGKGGAAAVVAVSHHMDAVSHSASVGRERRRVCLTAAASPRMSVSFRVFLLCFSPQTLSR